MLSDIGQIIMVICVVLIGSALGWDKWEREQNPPICPNGFNIGDHVKFVIGDTHGIVRACNGRKIAVYTGEKQLYWDITEAISITTER